VQRLDWVTRTAYRDSKSPPPDPPEPLPRPGVAPNRPTFHQRFRALMEG